MSILPLAFYYSFIDKRYAGKTFDDHKISLFLDCIHNVSSLTHAHKRSQIACGLYLLIAISLSGQSDLKSAIHSGLKRAKEYYENKEGFSGNVWDVPYVKDLKHYKRLFKKDFAKLPEEEIKSSGYVVDTLESALWCVLNTDDYEECILQAVNLGEDTDTVAAVAGGLAGMFYGIDSIPKEWLTQLARRDYIEKLCENFYRSLS